MINDSQNEIDGEVCTLLFYITAENNVNDEMYFHFNKERESLKEDVDRIVKKTLGKQFKVNFFEVSPGSVEILLTISTIGTIVLGTYVAISKYKNFIDSLNLAKEQIRNLFFKEAGRVYPGRVAVTGAMTLSPLLTDSQRQLSDFGLVDFFKKVIWILLIYLVFSHFVLLAYFIYSMLRRVI